MFDTARIRVGEWKDIPTIKEALGVDVSYLMLRGIFGAPGMPKEAVDWYVAFLKKVTETPEWKKYMEDGALKPAFASGAGVREVGRGERAAPPGPDDQGRPAEEVGCAPPTSPPRRS